MDSFNGFTLVELLFVVAIVGILSAVSFPVYQGYVYRSEVQGLHSAMINFITPIEDEILAGNISPVAADVVLDETAEALVDGVTVTMAFNESSGTIEGKYGDKSGLLTGEVLALGRTVEGGWLCFWSGAEDYAPQGCGN